MVAHSVPVRDRIPVSQTNSGRHLQSNKTFTAVALTFLLQFSYYFTYYKPHEFGHVLSWCSNTQMCGAFSTMVTSSRSLSDAPVTLDSVSWGRVLEFFVSCGMSFQNNMNNSMKLWDAQSMKRKQPKQSGPYVLRKVFNWNCSIFCVRIWSPVVTKWKYMSICTKCTLYINKQFSKNLHIL